MDNKICCDIMIGFTVMLLVFCYLDTYQNPLEQIWKTGISLTINIQTKNIVQKNTELEDEKDII